MAAPAYSRTQIGLHWLIAALVVFQLLFAEAMEEMVEAAEEGERLSASDALLGGAHYWVGIAVLVFAALRLALRLRAGAAPADAASPARLAAAVVLALFYVLLFVVPVVGLLAYYSGGPWEDLHKLAKPAFILLIGVHAAAALYHQFVLRDGTLRRILVAER